MDKGEEEQRATERGGRTGKERGRAPATGG